MISKLFKRANLEDPTVPLTGKNIADALTDRRQTSSGEMVGTREALGYSPVWSAVDQISSDVSRLPWLPYQETATGRVMLKTHPLYRLLAKSVDGGTTTTNIWLIRMLVHGLLYGNAYSLINWVKAGSRYVVKSLEFIHSDKVIPYRYDGRTYYEVRWNPTEDGLAKPWSEHVAPENMFHLQGLTINEFGGLSLMYYARETIGRQLAAGKYGDEFFANGAAPMGFFSHPGNLSEPAQNRFIAQMERRFSGTGNRHKLGFLEEDMKWVSLGITPKDALLIDAMKWGVPDVARFFTIPPHKLGDPSRQGWNTTEAENTSYYNSTLGKWTSRLTFESHKLFDTSEQDDCYTCFDTDQLLRADTQQRFAAYGVGIQWGFLTRNDVRRRENLEPLEGLDEPLTPVNMAIGTEPTAATADAPVDPLAGGDAQAEDTPGDNQEDTAEAERAQRLVFAQRDVVADQLVRMVRRVQRVAAKAAKEPRAFIGWLNGLEAEHGAAVREALAPAAGLIGSLHSAAGVDTLERITREFFDASVNELLSSADVQAAQLPESVDAAGERLLAWCRDAANEWITQGVKTS